jgi:uridine phosphorylase
VAGDPQLLEPLRAAAGSDGPEGAVVSSDLFYDSPEGSEERWHAQGARAMEMETATLFALAARRGLRAGCALIVSDLVLPKRLRIDTEALHDAERRLGELAVAALSGS